MSFQIDKGIQIPASRTTGVTEALRELGVGDSFFVPEKHHRAAVSIGSRVGTSTGRQFTSRTVTENGVTGVRIWRVA